MIISKRTLALATALAVSTLATAVPLRWNSPVNDDDTGMGLALDAAGNTFTVGTTDMGGATGKDVLLVARNAAGVILWQRAFDGGMGADESGQSIVLDGFGNLFVLASADNPGSGKDILLLKYTLGGGFLGRSYFNGPANGDDIGRDIAYDPNNFVVVVGSTESPMNNVDGLVIRIMDNFGAMGFRVWNGLGNGLDQFNAVALDPLGNIYLTGRTFGGASGDDLVFQRWAFNLGLNGTKVYNGPANGNDYGADIAYVAPGFIHIAGTSSGGAATGNDLVVMRFPRTKAWLLAQRYNRGGASDDRSVALAVDAANNTTVVGTSTMGSTDLSCVRFSPALGSVWVFNYNGPANAYDAGVSVATFGNNTYVTGASESIAGVGLSMDAATIGLNAFGAPMWVSRYDFAGRLDAPAQVAVNPMGVFVTGVSVDANQDQFTDRMNPATGLSPW